MEFACEVHINATTEFIPTLLPWMQAIFIVIDIVILLTATTGNVLVILSVCMYRKLRTPTNIFVTSLSIADLFVSCISIPTDIALALGFKDDASLWACLAGSSLIMNMSIVSVLHLLVIAYDRYLAIKDPFNYPLLMSKWRIGGLITFAWSVAAIFGIAPFCGLNNMQCYNLGYCDMLWIQTTGLRATAIFVAAITPFSLMSYMYFKIYKYAIQARQQIEVASNRTKRAWEQDGTAEM